jgi:DNA-3-methyladenine glycosylase II
MSCDSEALRPPPYWAEATAALAASDPVIQALIAQYPGVSLGTRGDPFHTLARAIVGQQISVKASDSVWARLVARLGAVTPDAVLAVSPDDLRPCGLSGRKVEYLGDLASRFADGRVRPDRWASLPDDAVMAELVAVRGIGPWTAEMYLIFHEMRPDVFPLDDIGLQQAVAVHYHGGERPRRAALAAFGERWRPWRSVATWYLWRSLDPVPVAY